MIAESRQDSSAWFSIRFGVVGDATVHLGEGWASPNHDYNWTIGHQSTIAFPKPREQRPCRLSFRAWPLFAPGLLERQRVVVLVNHLFAGVFAFDVATEQTASVELPWQMIDGRVTTTITFQFPDARSPRELGVSDDGQTLALAFRELHLAAADGPAPDGSLSPLAELPADLSEIMEREAERSAMFRQFESLGFDCEFGMVHRAVNIHSLGLLKWAGISPDAVVTLLEGGLDRVGKRDSLKVETTPDGEMIVRDCASGFAMHTFNYKGVGLDEEALLDREAKRLPRIATKLQEEIEDGEKMFIFKDPGMSGAAVARMLAALRSCRADNTLLWLRLATPDHPAGLVVPACPGLVIGFIPDRPPRDDPDMKCWTSVCERALAYRAELVQ